jgi:hypothetical protein
VPFFEPLHIQATADERVTVQFMQFYDDDRHETLQIRFDRDGKLSRLYNYTYRQVHGLWTLVCVLKENEQG